MTYGVIPWEDVQSKAFDYVSYYYETGKTGTDRYGITSGNWDKMGMSHGVIQFNLGSGTLQPIWKDLINNHSDVVAANITSTTDYNKFVDMILNHTTTDQVAWGETITLWEYNADGTKKSGSGHKLIEPWNTYFMNLGRTPESIARQDEGCKSYVTLAQNYKDQFGLWTRRGFLLLLDICIQKGSISSTQQTNILNEFQTIGRGSAEYIELRKMRIIAEHSTLDAVASAQASYRDRKLAIANGTGTVYGGPTTTVPYDMILEPCYESDRTAGGKRTGPKYLIIGVGNIT